MGSSFEAALLFNRTRSEGQPISQHHRTPDDLLFRTIKRKALAVYISLRLLSLSSLQRV